MDVFNKYIVNLIHSQKMVNEIDHLKSILKNQHWLKSCPFWFILEEL